MPMVGKKKFAYTVKGKAAAAAAKKKKEKGKKLPSQKPKGLL